jgi:uncharacterized protein (TIGR02996 family)
MQNPEYWTWVRKIFHEPHNHQHRLVFADWLDEHGMSTAARKQRQYARLVKRATVIFRIIRYRQIWAQILDKENKNILCFRIKHSGQIVIQPTNIWPNPQELSRRQNLQLHYYRRSK